MPSDFTGLNRERGTTQPAVHEYEYGETSNAGGLFTVPDGRSTDVNMVGFDEHARNLASTSFAAFLRGGIEFCEPGLSSCPIAVCSPAYPRRTVHIDSQTTVVLYGYLPQFSTSAAAPKGISSSNECAGIVYHITSWKRGNGVRKARWALCALLGLVFVA